MQSTCTCSKTTYASAYVKSNTAGHLTRRGQPLTNAKVLEKHFTPMSREAAVGAPLFTRLPGGRIGGGGQGKLLALAWRIGVFV